MSRPSIPPPGSGRPAEPSVQPEHFRTPFVRPVPVRGVAGAGGELVEARTVAEAHAANVDRANRAFGLPSAPAGRRLLATLLDAALVGAGVYLALLRTPTVAAAVMTGLVLVVALRVIAPALTDGRTPGRLLIGIRLVRRDGGAPVTLAEAAKRELLLLLSIVTAPLWIQLIVDVWTAGAFFKVTTASPVGGPIPHDESSGTTVALLGEIDRVRAEWARAERSRVASGAVASAAPPHHAPALREAPVPSAAVPHPSPEQAAGPPPIASPAPLHQAEPPRLAAAPYIPAIDGRSVLPPVSGIAVHTMEAPGMPRRFAAIAVDAALIAIPVLLVARLYGLESGAAAGPTIGAFGVGLGLQLVAVTIGAWLFVRPLALAVFGATVGHWLLRYRVLARRGERVGIGQALVRESAGWLGFFVVQAVLGSGWTVAAGTDMLHDPDEDQRWAHDRFAETWPILI